MKAYLNNYKTLVFKTCIMNCIEDEYIFQETYFYPGGGHQSNDLGWIEIDGDKYNVLNIREEKGKI